MRRPAVIPTKIWKKNKKKMNGNGNLSFNFTLNVGGASSSTTSSSAEVIDLTTWTAPVPQIRGAKRVVNRKATAWRLKREEEAQKMYGRLNKQVFDDRLPARIPIWFCPRLQTTAGEASLKTMTCVEVDCDGDDAGRVTREKRASIRLSEKVVGDDDDRMWKTLCHEMCHVAVYLLDGDTKDHHGPLFKKWGRLAEERVPGMTVSRCHDYKVEHPFVYECANDYCSAQWGRFSNRGMKKSARCGRCKSPIVLRQGGKRKRAAEGEKAKKKQK